MKQVKLTEHFDKQSEELNIVITKTEKLLDFIPYQVSRYDHSVTLNFSRFISLLSFKDTFNIQKDISKNLVTLKLVSMKNNELKIFIVLSGQVNKTRVEILVEYKGEKEWIVGKYLNNIAVSVLNGIKLLMETYSKTQEDLSHKLNSLQFLSNLMLRMKLESQIVATIKKGEMTVFLIDNVIRKYKDNNFLLITGMSDKYSFRLIYMNNEIKGLYLNDSGTSRFGKEVNLDDIDGEVRINVYTPLDKSVIKVITDAGL